MSARTYPTTPMCDGELLAAFEPTARDTDVFVATAAKCGQTWLITLLHHLRTRGLDPEMGGVGLHALCPWLELPFDMRTREPYDRAERLAEIEALHDPRVFKLHVIWEEIPRPPGSAAKVMTVTRDPRDLPWSMYAHLCGMRDEVRGGEPMPDFDTYFERWMDFGYFYTFVRSFWPHRDDPDVLWLRYEDLKADLAGEARRIVSFLGWDVDHEALQRAVGLADFGHMQRTERKNLLPGGAMWKEGHDFCREGAVGRNRARLSPEQEARIVARAREELEPECFEFVMSQGV